MIMLPAPVILLDLCFVAHFCYNKSIRLLVHPKMKIFFNRRTSPASGGQ
jgi:hypothetical protein